MILLHFTRSINHFRTFTQFKSKIRKFKPLRITKKKFSNEITSGEFSNYKLEKKREVIENIHNFITNTFGKDEGLDRTYKFI